MAIRQNGICEFTRDGNKLSYRFRAGIAPVTFDMESNPVVEDFDEFTWSVYFNGVKQKLGDSMALKDATDQQKRDSLAETAALLTQRIWSGERSSLLSEALQNLYKKSASEIGAFLRGLSAEEKTKVARDPAVATEIARLQVERAKLAGVSAADILAKL